MKTELTEGAPPPVLIPASPEAPGAQTIRMRAVPESERGDRAVVSMATADPLVRGYGRLNYSCATCDAVILSGINRTRFAGLLIKCGRCSTLNHVPAEV